MTDERAALIERLELMAIAEADTTAELIEDGADADVIACSREEAQFFKACAAEIARLSEEARALREALDDVGRALIVQRAWIKNWGAAFSDRDEYVGDAKLADSAILKADAALARAKGGE